MPTDDNALVHFYGEDGNEIAFAASIQVLDSTEQDAPKRTITNLDSDRVWTFNVEPDLKTAKRLGRWVMHLNGTRFGKELAWHKNYYRVMHLARFGRTAKIRKKNSARAVRLVRKAMKRWGVIPFIPRYDLYGG